MEQTGGRFTSQACSQPVLARHASHLAPNIFTGRVALATQHAAQPMPAPSSCILILTFNFTRPSMLQEMNLERTSYASYSFQPCAPNPEPPMPPKAPKAPQPSTLTNHKEARIQESGTVASSPQDLTNSLGLRCFE